MVNYLYGNYLYSNDLMVSYLYSNDIYGKLSL